MILALVLSLITSSAHAIESCPPKPVLRHAKATGGIWTDNGHAKFEKILDIDAQIPVYGESKGCAKITDPGTIVDKVITLNGKKFVVKGTANLVPANVKSGLNWLSATVFVDDAHDGSIFHALTILNGGAAAKDSNTMALFLDGERWVEEHSFQLRLYVEDNAAVSK